MMPVLPNETYDLQEWPEDTVRILAVLEQRADGPGDVYQIDATVADIYLVSHDDRSLSSC